MKWLTFFFVAVKWKKLLKNIGVPRGSWPGRIPGRTFSLMQWNRSNTIGLASNNCCYCEGVGLRLVYKNHTVPCGCVFRSIFRICLNRFRECVATEGISGTVSWEYCSGASGCRSYSRKREEFMADFCLISRRALEPAEHQLFRFYFLLGADWKMCSRRLNLDRGSLFHAIYRIERKLGRAFAETEPYGLFPLDEYFGGVSRDQPVKTSNPLPLNVRKRLQVPVKRAA